MPDYKKQLDDLLQQELSRAEFIKVVGLALLGVVGVSGFLKNLHRSLPGQKNTHNLVQGYGRGPYGR